MKKVGFISLLAVFALVLTACEGWGGGFIETNNDARSGKATFAFEGELVECGFLCWEAEGEIVFHDGDIKIKGEIDELYQIGDFIYAEGEYRTQPPGGEGDFTVKVLDLGEGANTFGDGDWFYIDLEGDVDYTNSGNIGGGNITVVIFG